MLTTRSMASSPVVSTSVNRTFGGIPLRQNGSFAALRLRSIFCWLWRPLAHGFEALQQIRRRCARCMLLSREPFKDRQLSRMIASLASQDR